MTTLEEKIKNKIDNLTLRLQADIKEELLFPDVMGCPYWEKFLVEMQKIIPESWVPALLRHLRISREPTEALFNRWAMSNSYKIVNLIEILKQLNFDALAMECEKQLPKSLQQPPCMYSLLE